MNRALRRAMGAWVAAGLAAAAPIPPASAHAQAPSRIASRPTLVVFITVDQLRPDYFGRFQGQLTGGLARLYARGAVFTNAFQDHAITETAPGHSVTMSGRFPVHTGITTNALGVADTSTTLVGARGTGASPFRFRGTTLADWLRAADPGSRILSVSRKDRGAILPVGRSKGAVFWYAPNGTFTTSTYYADTLPAWLTAFNARRLPQSFAGRAWAPILPDSAYPEPDDIDVENGGHDVTFPHALPVDTTQALAALPGFPWIDELTLGVALAGVRAMALGAGPHTDVLAVSLSGTDAVGHAFGPDSRELHDQILRLDHSLGAFLDTLLALRGPARVLVALTADHGVAPFPGIHTRNDHNTGARYVDLRPVVDRARRTLVAAGASADALRFDSGVLTVDRAVLAHAGVDANSVVADFREAAIKTPGVLRADRITDLQHADTVHDAIARRWLHMFGSDSAAALTVTLAPYDYWAPPGAAEHGSPHDYDAHVPLIFYGPRFRAGTYRTFTRVADAAPTLARALGVRPLERTDGHPLTQALR